MSSHVYHPPREDDRPILFDECEGCDRHAEGGGLTLDTETFERAWAVMVKVEKFDDGNYLTGNERKLCKALYEHAILLERHFGCDPWAAVPHVRTHW